MHKRANLQSIGRVRAGRSLTVIPVKNTGRPVEPTGIALRRVLMSYCPMCDAWREVMDWREDAEYLILHLGPCGHEARRTARLEWLPYVSRHEVSLPAARFGT
jgi:Zn ribbon nucleic-acid-binding protein